MSSYLPPTNILPVYNPSSFPTSEIDPELEAIFLKKSGGTCSGIVQFNLGLQSSATASFADGTVGVPGINFINSPTTGIYSSAPDVIDFSIAGVNQLSIDNTGITFTDISIDNLKAGDGTELLPSIAFTSDPNTGLYNISADTIGLSTGGTKRLEVSTSALTSTLPVVIPTTGSVLSSENDGVVLTSGSVALTTDNTARLTASDTEIASSVPMSIISQNDVFVDANIKMDYQRLVTDGGIDSVGAEDLTATGSPIWSDGTFDKYGLSLPNVKYNGTTQYQTLQPLSNAASLTGASVPISISCWVKLADLATSQVFLDLSDNAGTGDLLRIGYTGSTSVFNMGHDINGGAFSLVLDYSYPNIQTDVWYHLAWALDASGSTGGNRFYVNGANVATYESYTAGSRDLEIIAGYAPDRMTIGCLGRRNGAFSSAYIGRSIVSTTFWSPENVFENYQSVVPSVLSVPLTFSATDNYTITHTNSKTLTTAWTAATGQNIVSNLSASAYSPYLDRMVCISAVTNIGYYSDNGGVTWSGMASVLSSTKIVWVDYLKLFVTVKQDSTVSQYSANGSTWTTSTILNRTWTGLAVAEDLRIIVATSFDDTLSAYSYDGITWTTVATAEVRNTAVIWAPELKLFISAGSVASGNVNAFSTSPDGINWTSRASTSSADWNNVAWSPELSLLIGVNGTAANTNYYSSPDGINWTLLPTGITALQMNGCVWSAELGLFVVGSALNDDMATFDGTTWTYYASTFASGSLHWLKEYNRFVVCGNRNNRIYYSTNTNYLSNYNAFDSWNYSLATNTINNATTINTNRLLSATTITDRLNVNTDFYSAAPLLAPDGAVGAPSYSFTSDTNSGLYSVGADTIGFTTNGVKQLEVSTTAITSTLPLVMPVSSSIKTLTNNDGITFTSTSVALTTADTPRLTVTDTEITSTLPVVMPVSSSIKTLTNNDGITFTSTSVALTTNDVERLTATDIALTAIEPLSITDNTASTSKTTGALIVTGGAGIGGALYPNEIFLPSTGATASSLDFYTTGAYVTFWAGPWATLQPRNINYTRIGNVVTLTLQGVSAAASINLVITIATELPTYLRPSTPQDSYQYIIDNGNVVIGKMIVSDSGSVTFGVGVGNAAFTASGNAGFEDIQISYIIF